MAGYSGTPLIKKLGFKEGHKVALLHEPQGFRKLLGALPANTTLADNLTPNATYDLIHIFSTKMPELQRDFSHARKRLVPNGAIWISWPKKASGVKSDLDENV